MTNPQLALSYREGNSKQSHQTQNYPGLSPLLFNSVLKALARTVRQEEEIRGLQIRKREVKPSLLYTCMIYTKYPKNFTRLLETIISASWQDLNLHKSADFLYTNNQDAKNDHGHTSL